MAVKVNGTLPSPFLRRGGPYALLKNSMHAVPMTISLGTISSIFAPAASVDSGRNFLLARDASDPLIDSTLAVGKALANAMGNAQIKQVQGKSYLAANTAVERIKAQIDARKAEQAEKAKAAIAALDLLTDKKNKVDKTA